MRQAGIVAAAGVYALDHNVERLAEDNAARGRSPRAVTAGIPVDLERVETNFVQIDVGSLGLGAADAWSVSGRTASGSPRRSTRHSFAR